MAVAEKSSVEDHCSKCGFFMERGYCVDCEKPPVRGASPIAHVFAPNQDEIQRLKAAGFHVDVKNNGHHWVVTKTIRVDYWPSTKKYRIMNKGATLTGFGAMLEAIKRIRL